MKAQFDHNLVHSFYLWFDDHLTRHGETSLTGLRNFTYTETRRKPSDFDAWYSSDRQFVANGLDVPNHVLIDGAQITNNPTGQIGTNVEMESFFTNGVFTANNVISGNNYTITWLTQDGMLQPMNSGTYDVTGDNDGTDAWLVPMDPSFPWAVSGSIDDKYAYGLIIDFDIGRILTKDVPLDSNISGLFSRKEVNVYLTDQSEEDILINTNFDVSGNNYWKDSGEIDLIRYTLPAVFISSENSINEPFALGGMDNTLQRLRAVVITEDSYQLDAVLSVFRDSSKRAFKLISYEDFPFNQYWNLNEFPYTYTGHANQYGGEHVFIERVMASKLTDRANSKISDNLMVGFLDFELGMARHPRI